MIAQIAATFLVVAGIASLIRAAIPAAVSAMAGAVMLFLNEGVFSAATAIASNLPYLPSLAVTTTPGPAASDNTTAKDILALVGVVLLTGWVTGYVFALWRAASGARQPTRMVRFYLLLLVALTVLALWLADKDVLPVEAWQIGPLWSAAAVVAALLTFHRRRWSTPKFAVVNVKDNRKQVGGRRV